MRSAPPGSVPWAKAINVYIEGMMVAGRIGDLVATIAQLGEVTPAPGAAGRMALAFLSGTTVLDGLGRVPEGTAAEARFFAVIRPTENRDPLARFWWNLTIAVRASYAHDDPWRALEHSDGIQPIFDLIGGELLFLNMQLFRGMNLWYLGAFAAAERALGGIPSADTSLGLASSMRRFALCWVLADRGALGEARALATQLSEYGHAHQFPLEEGRGRWVLAEVLRRTGELEAAEREIQVALEMTVPIDHSAALGTLAAIRLAQGRVEDALAVAEDAVSRCTTMGGCGMFRGAFVRLAHAEALHATGAHDAARHAIAEARARLFTIVDRIADPAYKKSFLENVPENSKILALARAWIGSDF